MSKRKYTKIAHLGPEIIAMREDGKTRREIAEHLGLEKDQIKEFIRRYNEKQAKLAAGIALRPKDRPRKWVQLGQQIHSDQGFQYTSQAYFNLTQKYGITPSMSRRGNCYDNAMAENRHFPTG